MLGVRVPPGAPSMKKVTDVEIIQEIDTRQDEILSNISSESVAVYVWLRDEYEKRNINNNALFQFVFRSFYGLDNAGLTDIQKVEYFKLLEQKEEDLETILHKMYELPTLRKKNAIQFSFATKLLHTINNAKPIFDTEVSAVIGETRKGNTKEEKIESAKHIYAGLESLYPKLLADEQMQKIITKFKSRVANTESISNEKILDFLIWSLGKLKRRKTK